MASKKRGASASPRRRSVDQMKKWYAENVQKVKSYDDSMDAIKQLRDITKNAARTINSIDKQTVVSYLQNPNSNERNLRNVGWYLLSRSQAFQLIVNYLTNTFCLDARTIIPTYDLTSNTNNDDAILKSWMDTANFIKNWNFNEEFNKVIATCFIQDVSYNVFYIDEDGGLFILPLPADYCRIYSFFPGADAYCYMDMSYFNSKQDFLEAWGSPFTEMWQEYQSSGEKWQPIDPAYSACFKYASYDWSTILSPLSGLFSSLIDLLDVSDLQAVANQQQIFKMIYLKLKPLSNSSAPDQWECDPRVLSAYFSKMVSDALPDYATASIVPGSDNLGVIDFSSSNKAAQNNKVEDATKNVMQGAGVSHVLGPNISGTSAYVNAMIANERFATATLLPQIEGWTNRIIKLNVSNPSKVLFYKTGQYTKSNLRKELLEDATYGLPSKLGVMSLEGYTPTDMLAMSHLENDILKLGDRFNEPLSSSFTQSGDSSQAKGAPEKDPDQLTDQGSRSRER